MKSLLEAGVHFGHQTRRWNPKMAKYIFTARNGIYIIDLQKTTKLLDEACDFIKGVVREGKPILFVSTKRQAQEIIKQEAERCGMFFINYRWLGGMLTNHVTIEKRIARAIVYAQMASDSGKNINRLYTKNIQMDDETKWKGYKAKDGFIKEAITLCMKTKTNFRFHVAEGPDQNGNPSFIIYFTIKINGKREQISFHSFNKKLWKLTPKGEKTHWNRKPNGSFEGCKALIKYYSL